MFLTRTKAPLLPEVAAASLALQFVDLWMKNKKIQDPGERWRALPTLETIMYWSILDPESFFCEFNALKQEN